MAEPQFELSKGELSLLRAVGDEAVLLTRGIYRYVRAGSRAVNGADIQRLRALGLVVLSQASPPIPPTRRAVLTERGRAVLDSQGGS